MCSIGRQFYPTINPFSTFSICFPFILWKNKPIWILKLFKFAQTKKFLKCWNMVIYTNPYPSRDCWDDILFLPNCCEPLWKGQCQFEHWKVGEKSELFNIGILYKYIFFFSWHKLLRRYYLICYFSLKILKWLVSKKVLKLNEKKCK